MSEISEEMVYTVEKILKKQIRKSKIEYFVKWKGWGHKYSTWEPADNFLDKTPIIQFEERMKAESESDKDNKALATKKDKSKKRKSKPEPSTSKEAKKPKEDPPPKATLSGRVSKAPERYTKVIDDAANAAKESNKETVKETINKTDHSEQDKSESEDEKKKVDKTPEKREKVEKPEKKPHHNNSPMPQEVKSNADLQLNYPGVYALNRIQMLNRAQILKDNKRRLSTLSESELKKEEDDEEEETEQFTEWFPPDTWSYLHQVTVTDVTVGDITATMREASSPEGFFKDTHLSNPSA